MANWCDNEVLFSGKPKNVEAIKNFFKNVLETPERGERHWLAPFVVDLEFREDKIAYCSRWIPNNQALFQLATEFDVDFINRYNELNMGLFGEASCLKGYYCDVRLDPYDFHCYDYDAERKLYVYENNTYEYEWPIFEKMLEKKKAEYPYLKTTSDITKHALTELYGEMSQADVVLKFAEHNNFAGARAEFLTLDNDTLNELNDFFTEKPFFEREQFSSEDKYLAMNFLKLLVSEWNDRPPSFGLSR